MLNSFFMNSGELQKDGDRPEAGEVVLVPSFVQRIDVGYFHFVLKCCFEKINCRRMLPAFAFSLLSCYNVTLSL